MRVQIAVFALVAFSWGSLRPSFPVSFERPLFLHADDASPCPDNEDGHACNGSCPCHCCHGHMTPIALEAESLPTTLPRGADQTGSPEVVALPDGIAAGIFRPPRT